MARFDRADLLRYARGHKLAVVGTMGSDGTPTAALVGVAIADGLEIIFDTDRTSRKHLNLLRDPRACATFSGPGEQTLQYEGVASAVSVNGAADAAWREIYHGAWPKCREHAAWPNIAYWRLVPRWARFSDYDRGPLIAEFTWDVDGGDLPQRDVIRVVPTDGRRISLEEANAALEAVREHES